MATNDSRMIGQQLQGYDADQWIENLFDFGNRNPVINTPSGLIRNPEYVSPRALASIMLDMVSSKV